MADVPFLFVVIGSTLIDALVAAVCLLGIGFRRVEDATRPPQIGFGRVVLAILATAVVFGIKAAAFWKLGVSLFGMVHLVYVDLVA